MLKGDEGAYLLHDNNGRYAQDAIPVREGTTVYTDVLEIKTPPNSIKINATQCFPGNILAPAKHAKNWLRREASHVTVPERISSSTILECLWQNNENVGDSIMKATANTFNNSKTLLVITLTS